VAYIWI